MDRTAAIGIALALLIGGTALVASSQEEPDPSCLIPLLNGENNLVFANVCVPRDSFVVRVGQLRKLQRLGLFEPAAD